MGMVFGFAGAFMCIVTFSVGVLLGLKIGKVSAPVQTTAAEPMVNAEAEAVKKAEKQAQEDQDAWERMMGYSIRQAYATSIDRETGGEKRGDVA